MAEVEWMPEESALLKTAKTCLEVILPDMDALRAQADKLATLVADDLWPLPSYQEMLFMK